MYKEMHPDLGCIESHRNGSHVRFCSIKGIAYSSYRDDLNEWYAESDVIVQLARRFYSWSPFHSPEDVSKLEKLMDSIEWPPDPPDDDEEELDRRSGSDFWTIEKIFADL